MMGESPTVLLFFILVAGIVLIFLIEKAGRGRGRLRMPSVALDFDFAKQGWQRQRPKAVQGPTYWLQTKGGKWSYPLQPGSRVVLGRDPSCQILLTDPTADRFQAAIFWEEGRFKIDNHSQRSPTRVNGRWISRQRLGNGNKIQMGRTALIFRERAGRPGAPRA
jgi:hypothetical protein